ncbi:unnamed protein product [Adineta steineri]|uniref:Mothers against decapentaplegic homolog n=1 Tax=Adineta steineri TaxID=433720 RepID=A0A818YD38_9BILA|nr:unnamed protein product [Adineta steineri]CAF3751639.1 unnamed protein product [Adineta steineri]
MAFLLNPVRHRRSVSPVVQSLLELCVHYQQQQQNNQNNLTSASNVNTNDVNERSRQKIKLLVKRINKSKKNGSTEDLVQAILHKNSTSSCITIPRSPDASKDQSSPSNLIVEYCRLWRWPDLSGQHELKPNDYCRHAFHYNHDHICVNPFHYERVPRSYSVDVPRLPVGAPFDIRSVSIGDTLFNQMPPNTAFGQMPQNTTHQDPLVQIPSPPVSLPSPPSITSQDSFLSPSSDANNDENQQEPVIPMDFDDISTMSLNSQQEQTSPCERILFQEPREWCHISYYEFKHRVGEPFHATQPEVIIDGLTNPSDGERFCLGSLTNINRTSEIEQVRRHIGQGVRLFYLQGNLFAECMSKNPVFVQSLIANKRFDWHPATVCKIPPNVTLKIFDNEDFRQILAQAVREGFRSVHNLTHMCTIRMSFVKGWGVEYGRQAVTCTPCWVEIRLDGPFKWLDTILSTMQPTESVTSVS